MHDTRTMMIKPTALLLPALFFFPHAYAPAADLSENKAAGFALFKNKSPDTESVKLKPKFPVRIDTQDSEIKDMVEEHLPLITQQQEEVLDKEQTGFLAEEASDNVKTMLHSKGYFSSKVSLTEKDGAYTVHITPGPRTKIANVGVAILGDILSDGNLAEYYRNALENWQQPVGSDFDQDSWENSKTSVLGAVTRKAYPLAKLGNTRAAVNPDTATADLNVVVDSGRPIAFGDFEITGTQRYPEQIVSGMARFQPGTPYDLDLLLDFQQALEQNGHYSGASVQADFDHLQGDRVLVKVSVTEVKRHKLEAGIRLDSEYGLGGKIAYDYYNLFNKGYIGSVVRDMDKYETTLAAGISQPRNYQGNYWTSNVSYNRSTTQNLEKRAFSGGIRYVRDRAGIDARLGRSFSQKAGKSRLGYRFGQQPRHDADRLLETPAAQQRAASRKRPLPRRQNRYDFGRIPVLHRADPHLCPRRLFLHARKQKLGTFIIRGQAGYTVARDNANVPSGLMFRSGGASSVRGYELDSIGLAGPNGSVLPERALLVGSLEYQLPFTRTLSGAVFHDMGDAAANFKRMKLKHGSGLGVRWFSPLAPFSFDIAYGHSDKKIRWHISLGTRF